MWRKWKNKPPKGLFSPISYCFWPHSSSIYSKNFDSKLHFPPLQANCNPNAVSVQCMQVAIPPLVRICYLSAFLGYYRSVTAWANQLIASPEGALSRAGEVPIRNPRKLVWIPRRLIRDGVCGTLHYMAAMRARPMLVPTGSVDEQSPWPG